MTPDVTIIGGGLAGSEAAWQVARQGLRARLFEMRPAASTAAHQSDRLGELVCSNSLKSDQPGSAPHLLKQELRRLGSLLIRIADEVRVPAGQALAVDRDGFSRLVTEAIEGESRIEVVRQEVTEIPATGIRIIATGPLTSDRFSRAIARFTGSDHLYFYDAISPIVDATTLNMTKLFAASRYGKGGGDYINAPMNREEYLRFYQALVEAESVPPHEFEKPCTSRAACPSRNWHTGASTRCASAP